MGWGPNPIEEAAAEKAQAEAIDAAERKPVTPFERKLLGLIEDVRDAIAAPRPAGPLLVTLASNTPMEIADRIRARLPEGSLLTGENGAILDVRPIYASAPATTEDGLARLADAAPTDLGRAVEAAAAALRGVDPWLLRGYNTISFEDLAEAAIDAALQAALNPPQQGADARSGGPKPTAGGGHPSAPGDDVRASAPALQTSDGQDEPEDGAAGGDPLPPADNPTQ
ncbi:MULTISPECIES: hypothetical protein [unclassified Mycobacterium]|uniref:hypothetical protein n=1 Tax=unclassified Mycobacterium TaxID=2642494 RepID=UPI0029C7C023|nr:MULTISPECIES: hypothetical protein [unclassified Mycobacterium]